MKRQIEVGMAWNRDWHHMEVTKIFKNGKAQITETWISEDDGEPRKHVENYGIGEDESGQYVYSIKYPDYKLYAAGSEEWGGITEEELIAELEEQGYEVKEQETTTNTTNKEETKMARFEINGTIYEANDKGNYFYKSTGLNDKNGNPIMKRVSRAVYEQAFEEYTQQAQDSADAWETEMDEAKANAQAEQDRKDAETEKNFNKKHGMDIPKSALKANEKYVKKTEKKSATKRSVKNAAFQYRDITLTQKQVDFIHEAQQTNFYEHGVESTLWIDVLTDEIGGEFAGKPMTIGAMISTLKEKDLIYVGIDKINGKKAKFFGFTDLGQQVLEELG